MDYSASREMSIKNSKYLSQIPPKYVRKRPNLSCFNTQHANPAVRNALSGRTKAARMQLQHMMPLCQLSKRKTLKMGK